MSIFKTEYVHSLSLSFSLSLIIICSAAPYLPFSNGGQTLEYRSNAQIFSHPAYNGQTFDNDYALMRLDSPINNIEPAAMDQNLHSPTYEEG